MDKEHRALIKSSSGVSFAIFLCRILGLLREVLLAKIFGGGTIMTAWGLAFLLPNLFRRLLGEGALGTALVPIITHTIEQEGREAARRKLLSIFAALSLILASLCIFFPVLAIVLQPFVKRESGRYALEIVPVIMPYAFFICLVGVLSSILNSLGRYFLVALSAVSFNLFMIICLLFIGRQTGTIESQILGLKYLSVSVLLSGAFQLFFLVVLLWKAKMLPSVRNSRLFKDPVLKELYRLTLPGIIGASILQLSLVIDKSIAYFISDYAVPALNFSDRIIDLPIGIFAVAMGSVFLPKMSRTAAKGDLEGMSSFLLFALRNILFVSIPVSVFLIFFDRSVIASFYMRGRFGEKELAETALALIFYAPGIPFFCAAKIITSGFHSRKDMKTPLKITSFALVINVILNLILIWPLKQGGIALATVCSSIFSCTILMKILKQELCHISLKKVFMSTLRMLFCALFAGIFAKLAYLGTLSKNSLRIPHMPADFLALVIAGIVFAFLYLLFSKISKSEEFADWRKILLPEKK